MLVAGGRSLTITDSTFTRNAGTSGGATFVVSPHPPLAPATHPFFLGKNSGLKPRGLLQFHMMCSSSDLTHDSRDFCIRMPLQVSGVEVTVKTIVQAGVTTTTLTDNVYTGGIGAADSGALHAQEGERLLITRNVFMNNTVNGGADQPPTYSHVFACSISPLLRVTF